MAGRADNAKKLKVFVSYSRRDLGFVDQLVAVLEWHGFEAIIDRKGIYGAEEWEQRLGQLILAADIIAFVLSPDSATSEVCAWEVDQAVARGKRIIPVLCRSLGDHQPHPRLRDLNYIYFYDEPNSPGSGFGTGQLRLIEALSTDIIWLREHTRLEELAARWEASGRPDDQHVRGSELARILTWRENRPGDAPLPTPLQLAFLGASEEAEARRASSERKRLEEIAAAQEQRGTALQVAELAQREHAATALRLARRTILGSLMFAVTVALATWAFLFVVRNPTYFYRQTDIDLDGHWCFKLAQHGAKSEDFIQGKASIVQRRGSAAPDVSGSLPCVEAASAVCRYDTLASSISDRQLIFVYRAYRVNDDPSGPQELDVQRGVAAGTIPTARPNAFSVAYVDLVEETSDQDIKGHVHFARAPISGECPR